MGTHRSENEGSEPLQIPGGPNISRQQAGVMGDKQRMMTGATMLKELARPGIGLKLKIKV